ncbi:MAG: STAS domain-containing protein [Burkholderiales bacterium]|nr:STAS domain-containing protein [Burkholderiales bacterium]
MASTVSNHINDNKASLTISGRFDFSIHRDFRTNYEQILGASGVRELDVDLKGVDYVDSSALGMLLLLREKAMAKNVQMKLVGTQNSVRQVLEVANFGRLFSIS